MEGPFLVILFVAPLFIAAEWAWSQWVGRTVYERSETLGTLGLLVGMRVSRLAALPFTLAFLGLFEPLALVDLPATPAVFVAGLVVTDLVFYWHHRLSHEIPLLWAIHHTHHSATHLNLLASARLNWLSPWVIRPVVSIPLVVLGFPAEVVVGVAAFDLVFQFFLHTDAIPRLHWLEGWLNTPAAHRFHHASNPGCLDVNYAGVFTIWDRLFGTWVEPDLPVDQLRYGLTSGRQGNNPVWLVFGGFVRWARGEPI